MRVGYGPCASLYHAVREVLVVVEARSVSLLL